VQTQRAVGPVGQLAVVSHKYHRDFLFFSQSEEQLVQAFGRVGIEIPGRFVC
jgi:hypothetical protein